MKKKMSDWLLFNVVPFFASLAIRLLYRLNRIEHLGGEQADLYQRQGKRAIGIFWHDQLLLMAKSFPGRKAKILISSSKDGEIIARTIRYFGFQTVRGSSTRGGNAALKEMITLLAQGSFDLVITPDGPKGPRHQIKPGVVRLARVTGRPVFPLVFACSRGYRFNSWDRFLLPFPFGRGVFVLGEPVEYEPEEEPEHFRQRLAKAMEKTNCRARLYLEEHGVSAV